MKEQPSYLIFPQGDCVRVRESSDDRALTGLLKADGSISIPHLMARLNLQDKSSLPKMLKQAEEEGFISTTEYEGQTVVHWQY